MCWKAHMHKRGKEAAPGGKWLSTYTISWQNNPLPLSSKGDFFFKSVLQQEKEIEVRFHLAFDFFILCACSVKHDSIAVLCQHSCLQSVSCFSHKQLLPLHSRSPKAIPAEQHHSCPQGQDTHCTWGSGRGQANEKCLVSAVSTRAGLAHISGSLKMGLLEKTGQKHQSFSQAS